MWLKQVHCFVKTAFFLLPAILSELLITRTFFDFPWRFELSGVDCRNSKRTREGSGEGENTTRILSLTPGGGGGTPYNGLYGEASPERGTFFKSQIYKRVGISLPEVYERVGKSDIWVCKKVRKG